mmetsp:Transcript_60328/g.143721  ORF Transcript_60328/g.143721 Transcript_60328/m.143721 type:complete len:591 (-) Transcript_60328:201-1973(-)
MGNNQLQHFCCAAAGEDYVETSSNIRREFVDAPSVAISPRQAKKAADDMMLEAKAGNDIGLPLNMTNVTSPPKLMEKAPPAEEDSMPSPTSAAVLSARPNSALLPPEAADGTVWNRHKAYQERKRMKQEKRKLRSKKGVPPSLREGFLSNVPEVEADVQYRFSFIVMGIASEAVVTTVCQSEEARQMELRMSAGQNEAFLGSSQGVRGQGEDDESLRPINSMDSSPARRIHGVGTIGSLSSELNTIEAEMELQSEEVEEANQLGSERSLGPQDQLMSMMSSECSMMSSKLSSGHLSSGGHDSIAFDGVNSLDAATGLISIGGVASLTSDMSMSMAATDEPGRTMSHQSRAGSMQSVQSAVTTRSSNRCLCPVPYPWGRTKNQDRVKLAKLVFTPCTFTEAIMPCETRLEASSTALVVALIVDPGDAEPNFEAQLQSLVEAIEEAGYTRPHLRPARAVLLIQRSPNPPATSAETAENDGGWEACLQAFEKAHGALWRFGPTQMSESNNMYACFAKIASQRIYEAQNSTNDPASEDWSDDDYEDEDEWALNMKVGYKSERGGQASELSTPAQDKKAHKRMFSNMYQVLKGRR